MTQETETQGINPEDGDVTTLHDIAVNGPRRGQAPGYQVRAGEQPKDAPLYRLRSPCFLFDRLWDAGSLVRYAGKPNSEMVRVDESAGTPQSPAKPGRPKVSKDVI